MGSIEGSNSSEAGGERKGSPSIASAPWYARALDALAFVAFPQGCHVCGEAVASRADGVACAACWDDPRVTPLFRGGSACTRCGRPGASDCAACLPPVIRAARSVGFHAGALRAALLDLKRRPRPCARLGALLEEAYLRDGSLAGADAVVPVPLHPERRAARGHNQAASLARRVARVADLRVEESALARLRQAERRRSGAGRADRRATVEGAFHAAPRLVEGRRILLVDDILTTGATLAACATALVAAGALDVRVLTASRVR